MEGDKDKSKWGVWLKIQVAKIVTKQLKTKAQIIEARAWGKLFWVVGSFLVAALLVTTSPVVAQSPQNPDSQQAEQSRVFRFTGGGWGHGVGMSQYGAYGRAVDGQTHEQILDFYYEDTQIVEREVQNNIRILLTSGPSVNLIPDGLSRITLDDVTLNRPAINSNTAITLVEDRWHIQTSTGPLCPPEGCSGSTIRFHFATGSSVRVIETGHSYLHGRFTITKVDANELRVVLDSISMTHYLYGIDEIPGYWHLEVQKAQAIAARSYAYTQILQRRNNPNWSRFFDIYASVSDQFYSGNTKEQSVEADLWLQSVDATKNQILVDLNGNPVVTYYSSSNGGFTANSNIAFQSPLPQYQAKPDAFDVYQNYNHQWERTYSAQELSQWLNLNEDTEVGALISVSITGDKSLSGRINKADMEVYGTRGTKQILGERFYQAINSGIYKTGSSYSKQLPSTLLNVKVAIQDSSSTQPPQTVDVVGNVPTEPVGALNEFRVGTNFQNIHAVGWAFDGDVLEGTALETRFYLNGNHILSINASESRTDIYRARGYGLNSGFAVLLPLSTSGTTTYCVVAEDTAADQRTIIGCKNHGASNVRSLGELSTFEVGEDGRLKITGWALDPDEHQTPLSVQIFIDGALTEFVKADQTLEVFDESLGQDNGFEVDVELPERTKSICVRAPNLGVRLAGNPSTLLGCLSLD